VANNLLSGEKASAKTGLEISKAVAFGKYEVASAALGSGPGAQLKLAIAPTSSTVKIVLRHHRDTCGAGANNLVGSLDEGVMGSPRSHGFTVVGLGAQVLQTIFRQRTA
jgi:hypothetical protein